MSSPSRRAPRSPTELEITEGLQFDKGFISPNFVTDAESQEVVLEDPYILISTQKISSVEEMLPLLEKVLQAGKPLLIVAEDVEGQALSTLVVNALRKTFKVAAVKAPGFGDRRKAMLQDMSIATGGELIAPELGYKLDQVTLDMLGTARRVVVDKDTTTVVDGGGKTAEIQDRVSQIRKEIEASDSDWDKEKLSERLAKLSGGIAVIKVGAATEVEMKERKHRIEDAIAATKAAVEEGTVPGGGAALAQVASVLDDNLGLTGEEAIGVSIVRKALVEPLRWIAQNAGHDGYVVVGKSAELRLGPRPQRGHRRVRRPGRGRHHRPGQGDPQRGLQRRVDRRAAAHHGKPRGGEAGRAGARRRRWRSQPRWPRPPARPGLLTR